jgi:hypothetical protein
MQKNRLLSLGVRVAALGAVAWIALGIDSILRPVEDDRRDVVWMIPFALTLISFWLIHTAQKLAGGRFERIAYWSVMTASALAFAGIIGLVFGIPSLETLGFPLGAIVWMVGWILFGVATIKTRVFPKYVGIALILFEPGSILTGMALSPIAPLQPRGAYSAGLEKGAVLAAIAYGFLALQTDREQRRIAIDV